MKINGIDIRAWNANQLKVNVQPPDLVVNKELISGTLTPIEFETDVPIGRLELELYFRGTEQTDIIRAMSEFLAQAKSGCVLDLDNYKGKYKGYLVASEFSKTVSKKRKTLKATFEGYFYDEPETHKTSGTAMTFMVKGSRPTPCIVKVEVDSQHHIDGDGYVISGFRGGDVRIRHLGSGGTLIIDGEKGLVTMDGNNAFQYVDMWEFPALDPGTAALNMSSDDATVTVIYRPMWV